MAEPLNSDVAPAVEQPSAAQKPSSERKAAGGRRLRFELRHRFGLAYLVLAALVGAAVGLFVVFAGRDTTSSPTPAGVAWSTWHPQLSGELGAKEIARRVSPEYRLSDGRELVRAIAERPQYQNVRMNFNLIRPSDAQNSKDLALMPIGNGMMYILCGSGQSCTIGGTPSSNRLMLVRQEAIELALLTFKYDSDVDTVLSLLPPSPDSSGQPTVTTAMVFQRGDLLNQLQRPLAETLRGKPPFTPEALTAGQASRIRSISDANFFGYRAEQSTDGTPYLVLDPLA